MASETIAVIEDDSSIRELLEYQLVREGYKVVTAADGKSGLALVLSKRPAAILLDLMLPEMDGLEVCRQIRRQADMERIPVLMLTAKGEESDIVAGLEVGAEDYVTKPFSVKVVIARLRALLRRRPEPLATAADVVKVRDLLIDPGRHEVLAKGKPLDLTFTEFRLLHLLARRPGRVFTREQIVDGVRGEDYAVTDRAVDVQIVGLRRKLGTRGDYIETVRGVGYRFAEG
jgi:two-component system alkaline phosphatase synthesis response regulator PhoP